MPKAARFVIGVDYGTNSVRAIVVDCRNGSTVGSKVFNYPSGHQGIIIDKKDHNLARQHPADWLAGLEATVKGALAQARKVKGFAPDSVIAIGVDTTGSTPIPVDAQCRPLAFLPRFRRNPAAMAWLWKDHTSMEEAAAITRLAGQHRPQYLAKCGGTYSSEWFWSKVWHCLKVAPAVFDAAASWVEFADYIPALLAGITDPMQVKPGICPAGHKALYSDQWGGYPDREFLALLDPRLAAAAARRPAKACDLMSRAGTLCPAWATMLGLPSGIPIAIGAFDAHTGAIGAGVRPGALVKVIGTSTCDMTVAPEANPVRDIPGICGIVPGSILPGHYGIEAGQSAVGDIFKWFVEVVCKGGVKLHAELTVESSRLRPGQSGLLALDWNNGNRTVLVDPRLTGLLLGQTLHTTQAEIYRALIEATAYGARAIVERIKEYGVAVDSVICTGGIAEKNPMLMQIYADVLNCPMRTSASTQTCALGSAIAAAVVAGAAAGGHATFEDAQGAMTSVKKKVYTPRPQAVAVYDRLYALYRRLHDGFGGVTPSASFGTLMKELITIREEQSR
jgi:L-ribulokinase